MGYTESHYAECRYAECHSGLIMKAETIILTLFGNAATMIVTFQVNFFVLRRFNYSLSFSQKDFVNADPDLK